MERGDRPKGPDPSPVFRRLVGSLRTTHEHNRIFRIPDILYSHKKDAYLAYRPNGFSIGPWHHGKPYVLATSKIKDIYQEAAINRCEKSGVAVGLHRVVQNLEVRARRCYGEQISMDQKEFVEMLVRDSCFIVELLSRYYKNPSVTNETLPSTLMFQFTYHDLILLENQIPWFVLEKVYEVVGNKMMQLPVPLHVLVLNFFSNIFTHDGIFEPMLSGDQQFDHILDLLRRLMFVSCREETNQSSCGLMSLVPNCFKSKEKLDDIEMARGRSTSTVTADETSGVKWHLKIPSASRLDEAGVKFKRSKSKPMLYVGFHKGVLELPQLIIDDNTEALFRNLIAYEQCQWKGPPAVTSFAKLMDHLIDTVEDVHILSKNDVICNTLDPEDVVQIFNRICTNTYIDRSYYGKVYNKVNGHCRQWWPRWRAFYLRNYFGKPWAIVSQIFALIILVLTILQVVLK